MIADLKPYAEYKESGLPWLGQVPKHWASERAKWLFTKMDRPVREEDEVVTCFRDGMVTLRRNRRLSGFTEATAFFGYQGIRKGDLVIHGMDAFAGAIGVSDSDGKGTPVYNVCQPNPGVSSDFYAYLVRQMSRSQWILALAKGIRERSTDFRFETFGNQRVPLPPPDEQAAIVRFLDWANGRLERAIRAKRKVIALLNEQKQAIIHRAVTRGLAPSVPLKPSGISRLGDIPEHWELVRSGSMFRLFGGYAFPGTGFFRDESDTSLPLLLTPINFDPDGGLRFGVGSTIRFRGEVLEQFKLGKRSLVTVLTDLSSRRLILGRAGFIDVDGVLLNQRTARVDIPASLQARLSPEYLCFVLNSPAVREQTIATSRGSTVFHTSPTRMLAARWPLPPIQEQHATVEKLESLERQHRAVCGKLREEIELLREYRTRLVADVVTGKLDVREAAARLPDEAPLDSAVDDADLSDQAESADEETSVA